MVLFLVLAVSAAADLCADTDNGPVNENNPSDAVLAMRGTVEYGITDKDDVCLTSPSGVSTDESPFLQEFFCEDDRRESEVYTCTDYGFTGCKDGACIGKNVTPSNQTNQTPSQPVSQCGNKIVEKDAGETCDPPGSICFGDDVSQYGQCTDTCTCKLANPTQTKCGNGEIDEGENCESDSDCAAGEVCKSCLCSKAVTNTTGTINATNTTRQMTEPVNKTEQASAEIDEKYPDLNVSPVEIGEVKNFSEDPGIKTTGAISRFFTGVWEWIVSLFS